VILAGGGTAGHVEPALATADAVRRAEPDAQITMLGTERGLETRLVPERGYELALIPAVPLPRRLTAELFRLPAKVRRAVDDTAAILRDRQAEGLIGFGGYVALPAYLAARRLGVPIVVHEANAKPGLANRIGSRFTSYVATAAPGTRLPHAQHIGIPLRRALAQLDRSAQRAQARAFFGLAPNWPTLLAFGGSQGARRINQTVDGALADLLDAGIQVLHVVGPANTDRVLRASQSGPEGIPASMSARPQRGSKSAPGYVPLPYIDRMDLAYAAADVAICRAGAVTCAELAAVGLPAIYVPLAHGNGEQRVNAEPTVAAGGGLLAADALLSPSWLVSEVIPLLKDAARLQAMAAAAATLGRRDADDRLVEMIRQAITAQSVGGRR
jgi:UDP-N-acetylglucosamine--N-acetylmuramyl-(pentapeptide) pyrophosphoryl-undecaprenol N-acetylglucosamine transferase